LPLCVNPYFNVKSSKNFLKKFNKISFQSMDLSKFPPSSSSGFVYLTVYSFKFSSSYSFCELYNLCSMFQMNRLFPYFILSFLHIWSFPINHAIHFGILRPTSQPNNCRIFKSQVNSKEFSQVNAHDDNSTF
jgi:hypothetical protein